MKTRPVKVGPVTIGGDAPIVPQTMLNTHTSDIEATLAQAVKVADAGAQLIRITVPALSDVECLAEIRGPDPETAGRILQQILKRLRPPDAGPPQKTPAPPIIESKGKIQ